MSGTTATTDLVDAHCHLDLYPDLEKMVQEVEQIRVHTLAVTTTPKAWKRNAAAAASSRFVHPALGLHPQLVAERAAELGLWKDLLPQARFVGEVGLDAGPRFYGSFQLQQQVFKGILESCAEAGGKVLSVHSVRSSAKVLDLVEEFLPSDRGTVILHWFTGSASEARRAVEHGCYFSVNREMLGTAKGRSIVAALPTVRLLTETDGPFTQVGGRPVRPGDIATVTQELASLFAVPESSMRTTISENFLRLLGP